MRQFKKKTDAVAFRTFNAYIKKPLMVTFCINANRFKCPTEMKNFKYLSILLIACVSLSCKKLDINSDSTISYGTSFGFCGGYCKKELVVNQEMLRFNASKNGNNPDTKTCSESYSQDKFDNLADLLDAEDFEKLETTIGCPDCADGGAEWVEVRSGVKVKRVTFEYGKAPKDLDKIVSKLRDLAERFKDCAK